MATAKTLFDAIEGELTNARAALNNAGAYMDMAKDAVNKMEKSTGMEAPLSLSSGKSVTDLLVKTESGEYVIPLAVDPEEETLIYGFEIRTVNNELKEHLKLL